MIEIVPYQVNVLAILMTTILPS